MLAIIAATLTLMPSCGYVDPVTNSGVWMTRSGRIVASSYSDFDGLRWHRPQGVPFYIHMLATRGKGTKIRKGCA